MQLRFNVGFLALVALLGLTTEALAERQEFTKTINKEFPITADGFTELQNKYGNVTVRTWNQNKVKIDIVIKVQARDQSAAQTAFDRINVVFSNSASSVRAVTEIESSRGGWWNWGDSSNDFKIHYDVYVPEQGSLTVGVKYGNVATAAIGGILNLDVKYGNIKADGAEGQTTIALSYGNGTLTRARNITANVAYGDFSIGEAQEITARGRYGHYKIDRATNIRADSRYHNFEVQQANRFQCDCGYDNLKFGQLGELVISGSYTDAEVRQLSRRMTLNLSYGDVEIDRLESGFSEIDVTVNYTDIKIGVDPAAQYSVDVTGHYTDVNVPSSLSLSYDYEKSSSRQIKGQTSGGGSGGVIRGKLSYGDFNLYRL